MSFTQQRVAQVIKSDEQAIQVAQQVAQYLAPGASERDQHPRVPYAELEELSVSGLLALTVPKAYGGADVSYETIGKVFQILSAADPAVTQLPQSHFVFLNAIRHDGTEDQKKRFFADVLAGARLGNAQAEKGSTSALDLQARLKRRDDQTYLLNGIKHYCTGAVAAHWIPVAAIDDDGHLILAYVPREAPGVEALEDWNAMGQRSTFSGTVHLRDVVVPRENVVDHWKIFERPTLFHSFASYLHAAIDVGIAQNALFDAAAAVRSRKRPRLGAAVSRPTEDPHVILRFGQLLTKYHASELLLERAGRLLDQAASRVISSNAIAASVAVSEAKAFAEDVVIEITNDLFSLVGSSATDQSYNWSRHWRNARTHTVHDANHWRYHSAGNHFLNGAAPEKPYRHFITTAEASPLQAATQAVG